VDVANGTSTVADEGHCAVSRNVAPSVTNVPLEWDDEVGPPGVAVVGISVTRSNVPSLIRRVPLAVINPQAELKISV
jgi:hypothetical protein